MMRMCLSVILKRILICLQNQRKWFTVLIRTRKIGSSSRKAPLTCLEIPALSIRLVLLRKMYRILIAKNQMIGWILMTLRWHELALTYNMWDLTPDTDLLKELPEEYTFETALADLINNSLQAVWSNYADQRRLIKYGIL